MTGIENRLWAADYWLRCTKLLMKAYEQNKPDDLICCLERLIIEIEKYSEDQPRDDHGRWTSGGGSSNTAHDSGSGNVKITNEAIANVPNVNIFDDKEKNARYQQANKDMLKEAQKYPVGTEVSRVYDADMNPIVVRDDEGKIVREYGYTVGGMGSVKIDDPGVPYHAFHNHPSGNTLSVEDMIGLSSRKDMISVTAIGNDGKVFCLEKSDYAKPDAYKLYLFSEKKNTKFLGKYSHDDIKAKDFFSKNQLADNEKELLKKQVSDFTEKCVSGGAWYGFRYKKS